MRSLGRLCSHLDVTLAGTQQLLPCSMFNLARSRLISLPLSVILLHTFTLFQSSPVVSDDSLSALIIVPSSYLFRANGKWIGAKVQLRSCVLPFSAVFECIYNSAVSLVKSSPTIGREIDNDMDKGGWERCKGDSEAGNTPGLVMLGSRWSLGIGWGADMLRELGFVTQPYDADACGHPLQSSPTCQESFGAETLLSLHKRHHHYNREKEDKARELSCQSVMSSHVHVRVFSHELGQCLQASCCGLSSHDSVPTAWRPKRCDGGCLSQLSLFLQEVFRRRLEGLISSFYFMLHICVSVFRCTSIFVAAVTDNVGPRWREVEKQHLCNNPLHMIYVVCLGCFSPVSQNRDAVIECGLCQSSNLLLHCD